MPLLVGLVEAHRPSKPLRGVSVLLIQHQLQDAYAQVQAFRDLGVDLSDLYWIDIPYTSFRAVREAVQDLGVPSENLAVHDFSPMGSYTSYQLPRVRSWLERHWDSSKRWVVLDDGGYFLGAVQGRTALLTGVALVEQTQRGMNTIRRNPHLRELAEQVPLINVAESKPKKQIEPSIIAKSIAGALEDTLNTTMPIGPEHNWLILGFGSIGSAVAAEFVDRFDHSVEQIHVFDPDPERQAEASNKGHPTWKRRVSSPLFSLVLGCAGSPSFARADVRHLREGSFVASGSSGSLELSRDEFIQEATAENSTGVSLLNVPDIKSLHSPLEFNVDGLGFTILNGGFPVNFDGKRIDRISTADIQLTASLMVCGAIQASKTTKVGITDLDIGLIPGLHHVFPSPE
jgi:S-adenosylhomocysteine hydrolase